MIALVLSLALAGHQKVPVTHLPSSHSAASTRSEREVDAGPAMVDAGPQDFTAEALPSTPKLGEPFAYTVSVTHPAGEVYSLPKESELGDFDVVASTKDDVASGDQVKTTFHLMLRAWALGSKAIPDLLLEIQQAQGVAHRTIPGPTVEITGVLDVDGGSEAPLRDLAPPVMLHVRTYRALAWIAGALALLALAFFGIRYLRREHPVVAAPAPPPIPPHVRARQALEALLAQDLPNQGRQREFYFLLSEIVRRYVGECFGFDSIDLTTEELLSVLRTRPTPGLDFTRFKAFCEEADLAKFAKFQPDASQCKSSIDAALLLVQATTPAPAFAGGGRG